MFGQTKMRAVLSCVRVCTCVSACSGVQDLANFLLLRGPYAWLGYSWVGCSVKYARPPEMDMVRACETCWALAQVCVGGGGGKGGVVLCASFPAGCCACSSHPPPRMAYQDYGEPVDATCYETAPNSGVFTRKWTKATVTMDCNTWTPTIAMNN